MNTYQRFLKDVEENKIAEQIALDVLREWQVGKTFQDVSDLTEYHHKGDILGTNTKDGSVRFFEVKNDSRIADTGNVLCEECVYYEDSRKKDIGWMEYCNGYLTIVSQEANRIYILDAPALRKYYRQGRWVPQMRARPGQYSSVFLFPLERAERLGILLFEIDYECVDGSYKPTNVKKVA